MGLTDCQFAHDRHTSYRNDRLEPPLPRPAIMTVWTSLRLSDDAFARLKQDVLPHHAVVAKAAEASNLVSAATDAACRSADIAFGQPSVDDVLASNSLRWVHLSSAGYTRFDRPPIRAALLARGCALTTSSGVYANPCAQHALAMMLAHNRRLPDALIEQRDRQRWAYGDLRGRTRTLDGQTVLLVGFGSIARRLVELLRPFNANVSAVRRSVAGDEPVATHPISCLDDLLPSADHVVNLLPSATGTERLFHAARFARMRVGAGFYNVGRGDTVDQSDLIEALSSGRPAAAYLDVTTPEPLPADHPLWQTPNCFITPHIAGGMQEEQALLIRHFLENLRRFDAGRELLDRVV